jgi:hypothetical protein
MGRLPTYRKTFHIWEVTGNKPLQKTKKFLKFVSFCKFLNTSKIKNKQQVPRMQRFQCKTVFLSDLCLLFSKLKNNQNKENKQNNASLILSESSHIWEDFQSMGSLPMCGKSSNIWEVFEYTGVFPCVGNLPIWGTTSDRWEILPYIGSLPTWLPLGNPPLGSMCSFPVPSGGWGVCNPQWGVPTGEYIVPNVDSTLGSAYSPLGPQPTRTWELKQWHTHICN